MKAVVFVVYYAKRQNCIALVRPLQCNQQSTNTGCPVSSCMSATLLSQSVSVCCVISQSKRGQLLFLTHACCVFPEQIALQWANQRSNVGCVMRCRRSLCGCSTSHFWAMSTSIHQSQFIGSSVWPALPSPLSQVAVCLQTACCQAIPTSLLKGCCFTWLCLS